MPIAAALPYVMAAVSIYSAVNRNKGGGEGGGMMMPPAPPMPIPNRNSPETFVAGMDATRRARAAIGSMANIATSPAGVIGGASTTGKSLLGM